MVWRPGRVEQSVVSLSDFSDSRQRSAAAQQGCWRLLREVGQVLDLTCADVIEVVGPDASAHLQLLARQFPGQVLEFGAETDCVKSVRVFWSAGAVSTDAVRVAAARCDALVVRHEAAAVAEVLAAASGLARVFAQRDAGQGLAVSVFGRGLARDLFRRSPAGQRAA